VVLASAPSAEPAVLRAEIDPRAARDRAITPFNDRLGDRRPDLYAR
jgi:hypothetical protein